LELYGSIERGTTRDFLRTLTHECDALLIDDADFLSGKLRTQTFFRRAVEDLVITGKHVVLAASDSTGPDIDELVAGFPASTIVRLRRPSLDQRVAALVRMAERREAPMPLARLRALARQANTIVEARCALERVLAVNQLER